MKTLPILGRLARAILLARIPIVVLVILLTAGSVYLLPRIQIDADYLNYLPPDDPDVQLFKEVGRQFGGTFIAMVAKIFLVQPKVNDRRVRFIFKWPESSTNSLHRTGFGFSLTCQQ